ncbi:MAG: FkbM family methyltransferase [Holosporaceae bacterium]|jgi:FkbM family methyltransferase|nr:FkbM family methyltransferase [Holosporaceae bacterium]
MIKLEKRSFVLGLFVCSAFCWLLEVQRSLFSIQCDYLALILGISTLASVVAYVIIRKNWTNVLVHGMYRESLEKRIAQFKDGVDERSSCVLDYVHACMDNAMFWNFPSRKASIPFHQYEDQKNWLKEAAAVRQKCAERGISGVFQEVFYFHHRLRFAQEKVLEHIRERDILDCGAYVGDSALVLEPYTNGIIYSFEFSRKSITKFRKVMQKNEITSKVVLIEAALGDHCTTVNVADSGKHNNGLSICAAGDPVPMTTVDEEVKKRGLNVGFIKADLEGYGFKMIRGALNTIKTQRPVLSIGIYHNYEELFEITPFLQKEVKDYLFEFQLHRFAERKFVELTLFCYPKELK